MITDTGVKSLTGIGIHYDLIFTLNHSFKHYFSSLSLFCSAVLHNMNEASHMKNFTIIRSLPTLLVHLNVVDIISTLMLTVAEAFTLLLT